MSGSDAAAADAGEKREAPSRATKILLLAAVLFEAYVGALGQLAVSATFTTDGIAYLRTAKYWAEWDTRLMITGYWSPLLSWMIAPFLRIFDDPAVGCRIVLWIGAQIFFAGAIAFLYACRLRTAWLVVGSWICALWIIWWQWRQISPDMLAAGLLMLAIACFLIADERESLRWAAGAGALIGAGYLAKSVALPVGVAFAGAFTVLLARRSWLRPFAIKALACTYITAAVIAGPWIGILSARFGKLTLSTSAAINHQILAPQNPWRDPDRTHRFHPVIQVFHHPEPGRVTSWEEPSYVRYPHWSALASRENFLHQMYTMAVNVERIIRFLREFEPVDLVPYALLAAIVSLLIPRRTGAWRPLRVAGLFTVLHVCSYLPFYGLDPRYHYVLLPFALAAIAASFELLFRHVRDERHRRLILIGAVAIVTVNFAVHIVPSAITAPMRRPNDANIAARALAVELKRVNIVGPVAGSAYMPDGGDTGLYVAYLLDQPWYGDEGNPSLPRLKRLRPRLILALRESKFAARLAADPAFRDLDPLFFKSRGEASQFPVKAFELLAR